MNQSICCEVLRNLRLVKRAKGTLVSEARRSRLWRAARLVIVLVSLPSTSTWGVDPDRYISQYRHTAWRIQDGLFRAQPNAITQTSDGYIWFGTQAGLLRFDGARFVSWTPPDGTQLPSSNVTSLLASRDGSLWIGTDAGLSHWVDGRLNSYLSGWRINAIVEDRRQRIWIVRSHVGNASNGPLCEIIGTTAKCYRVPDDASIGHCCGTLIEDSSGNLWMGANAGLLRRSEGSFAVYSKAELKPSIGFDGIEALAATSGGSLLVGMDHGGPGLGLEEFEFAQGAWKPLHTRQLDGSKLEIFGLFLDRDKALWIGTQGKGIYRIRGSKVDHFGSTDGLSSDWVNSFYQDHEGDVWAATSKGIDQFRDVRVVSFSREEGLYADQASSVLCSRDGTTWIGNNGSLDFLRGETLSSIREGQGLPGREVTSLLEDHAGRSWVGIDNGLFTYQSGRFTEIKAPDGKRVRIVTGIAEDVENNIWAVTSAPSRKLVRIRDFKVVEELQTPQIPAARTVASDRHAGIWLRLIDGGLARYRNGRLEVFPFKHGANPWESQVIVNADDSVLGASGAGLIGWKNGKPQTMTSRNGLPCDSVLAVVPHHSDFWLYTQCGLVEVTGAQMQGWWQDPEIQLHLKVTDELDGARPGPAPFSPPACESPDGKLWFATNSVLQRFDPGRNTGNLTVPPVHVEQIIADGKTYLPDSVHSLPALVRSLELDYTAPSFVAPEKVRFRYKLEGHDVDWQDAGTRRQAFYSDLSPGKYQFRVIAANNDGLWNDEGSRLSFSIALAWLQTTWFRLPCLAAFGVAVWAVYQLRVRQSESQFSVGLEARVSERTRIARELHDTLLQSFHGLMFQFQAARNMLPRRPGEAMEVLDSAIGATSQAISEGRGAIQQLRSEQVDEGDLAQWLTNIGEELARSQQTNGDSAIFRVTVEGEQQSLSPLPRTEVRRITREILQNAFRHAQAYQIEAEIRYDDCLLRVRIRDDGRGIDPQVLQAGGSAGHWGLRGARERAEQIGGRLDFWSEAGAGTEVELSVPAVVAYEKWRNKQRFTLFRKEQGHEFRS